MRKGLDFRVEDLCDAVPKELRSSDEHQSIQTFRVAVSFDSGCTEILDKCSPQCLGCYSST